MNDAMKFWIDWMLMIAIGVCTTAVIAIVITLTLKLINAIKRLP